MFGANLINCLRLRGGGGSVLGPILVKRVLGSGGSGNGYDVASEAAAGLAGGK